MIFMGTQATLLLRSSALYCVNSCDVVLGRRVHNHEGLSANLLVPQ